MNILEDCKPLWGDEFLAKGSGGVTNLLLRLPPLQNDNFSECVL